MVRVHLEAKIGERKSFRAYTDGGLRPKHRKHIQAAVETKKSERDSIFVPTAKQELSEVVAMAQGGRPAIYNGQ